TWASVWACWEVESPLVDGVGAVYAKVITGLLEAGAMMGGFPVYSGVRFSVFWPVWACAIFR
ncbi:hypothetical protein A2U01_0038229, partial [Trifolium medium]|nr:hypothetical protein [Trifolium medium]